MDAPPVRYVTTADGVRSAYWTLGDGPPMAHMQEPFGGYSQLARPERKRRGEIIQQKAE